MEHSPGVAMSSFLSVSSDMEQGQGRGRGWKKGTGETPGGKLNSLNQELHTELRANADTDEAGSCPFRDDFEEKDPGEADGQETANGLQAGPSGPSEAWTLLKSLTAVTPTLGGGEAGDTQAGGRGSFLWLMCH